SVRSITEAILHLFFSFTIQERRRSCRRCRCQWSSASFVWQISLWKQGFFTPPPFEFQVFNNTWMKAASFFAKVKSIAKRQKLTYGCSPERGVGSHARFTWATTQPS